MMPVNTGGAEQVAIEQLILSQQEILGQVINLQKQVIALQAIIAGLNERIVDLEQKQNPDKYNEGINNG